MAQPRDENERLQHRRARYRRNKAAQRQRLRDKTAKLQKEVSNLIMAIRRRHVELEELKTRVNLDLLCQAAHTQQELQHDRIPSDIGCTFNIQVSSR